MGSEGSPRVFLIEDSSDDEFFIRRAVERLFPNVTIDVANDGDTALGELLRDSAAVPQLILIDVKLPKVSGLDVLKALRREERYRKTPIVVLTSSAERSDIETAYRMGANGYVSKPVKLDEYVEKFAGVLHYWLTINTN